MTDEALDDTMWETTRPWEEQWESLKVTESKEVEQGLDDENSPDTVLERCVTLEL